MYTIIRQTEEENTKLHNEVDNLLDFEHLTSVAVAYAGCDECGEYKQTMLRLFAENAKLREYITWLEEAVIERGDVPSQTRTWLNTKRFELGIKMDSWTKGK